MTAKVAQETVPNPLRFQGREFDASTRLYDFRARWYDPELQRFTSQDPLGLLDGPNPYVYAGNDPLNRHDPSGLAQCRTVYIAFDPNNPPTIVGAENHIVIFGNNSITFCPIERRAAGTWMLGSDWMDGQYLRFDPGEEAAYHAYLDGLKEDAANAPIAASRERAVRSKPSLREMLGGAKSYLACAGRRTAQNFVDTNRALKDQLGWLGTTAADMVSTGFVTNRLGGSGLLGPGVTFVRQVATKEALSLGWIGLETQAMVTPFRGTLITGANVQGTTGALAIIGEGVVIGVGTLAAFEVGVGIGSGLEALWNCARN